MQRLPCTTFSIQTQAGLSKVIQRLNVHIEASQWFYPDNHAPYMGTLSPLGFKIRRIVHRRHPFLPIVEGRFEERSDGTQIYLKFKLSSTALLGLFGLGGLTVLATVLLELGWLPLILFGLTLPVIASIFWREVRRSRRELTKILLGASLKSHRHRLPKAYKALLVGLAGLALAIGLYQVTVWEPSPVSFQPRMHDCVEVSTSPYCQLRPVYSLTGHPTAKVLAMSANGKTLISGGRDKTIRVWDTATGQLRKTLQSNSGVIRAVEIAPNGTTIVSGGGDVRVRIWDITSNQPPKVLVGHTVPINQVKVSDDSKTLVSAGDGEIKVWDIATGRLKASLPEAEPVSSLPSGLSSPPALSTAALTRDPAQPSVNLIQPSTFRLLAISPDGGTALLESGNQWLSWDVATRQTTILQTPWADTLYGFVRNAQISLDDRSVVTTAYNHPFTHLKVWDLTTGEAQAQSRMSASDQKYWMNTVALSRDRIVGSTPEGLKIWHLATAELEATVAAPQMTPLVISRDGKHLAGIVGDGPEATIQVWQRPALPEPGSHPKTMPPLNHQETTVS
ncbi:MAG: hypothetical protein AAF152_16670 [Cyanobacteria bacterium P01_A01_bin.114]